MVSIPDWSRFGHLTDGPQQNTPSGSHYKKLREKETIKQAEDSGFINYVDKFYIEKHILGLSAEFIAKRKQATSFLAEEEEKLDLSNLFMVRLPGACLRTVGEIGQCNHIRICNLSNNFIKYFDALDSCKHLVKLDLHGNHIQHIPPASFWASKPYLSILNLHDNPIGSIETLHRLSASPNLLAVTMYDSPLSLKRNYRHHVVNSLWCLKALDCFVISDEEIIEDADFNVNFTTMHPNFAINLCPRSVPGSSYQDEMRAAMEMMSEVNQILKHNSPVLIIQRYWRGYVTRKSFAGMADTRTWLAGKKQLEDAASWKDSLEKPPPPSPAESRSVPSKVTGGDEGSMASTRLDYDTYMSHRRPGSIIHTDDGASTVTQQQQQQQRDETSTPITEQEEMMTHRMPGTPVSPRPGAQRHIYINLTKLEIGTLQSLNEMGLMERSVAGPTPRMAHPDKLKLKVAPTKSKQKKKAAKKKRHVIKDVREFFGPIADLGKEAEKEWKKEMKEEEKLQVEMQPQEEMLPMVKYKVQLRLKGEKQYVKFFDPLTDMIIEKRDAGRLIRATEYDLHEITNMQPEPVIEKSQPNAEKRIFNRVHGTMGLSCLRAVDQAYKDRAKAEANVRKVEFVMNMKEQKEAAKERVRLFNEERRVKTLKEREKETKKNAEVLEKRELQRIGTIDKSNELRNKHDSFFKHRRGELTFMSDFNAQNTSVSNALLRHDRLARREDKQQVVENKVQGTKASEQDQKQVVKKYLEHRQLMRQTESALARAALDTKMLNESNNRYMEAVQRVAHLREINRQPTQTQIIVPTQATFILPPLPEEKKSQQDVHLERWGTSVYASGSDQKVHLSRYPATALT